MADEQPTGVCRCGHAIDDHTLDGRMCLGCSPVPRQAAPCRGTR